MNHGILAARAATALADIERETRRLGGELTITPSRGDAAHRQLHTLEAIAVALAGIGAGDVTEHDVTEPPAPTTGKSAAKGKGQ